MSSISATYFAMAASTLLLSCVRGAPPAFPRPLEKGRAIAVIAEAYREGGQLASGGREIRLPSGTTLRMDVGTAGHDYGVAYLTTTELASLDPPRDLPPRVQV